MLKTVSSITNAIGALNYKGTWDANANSPALASSVGTKGDYYVVSTAGSTNLNGISNWGVGDLATFNGSVWQRVEGGADLNGVNLSVSGTSTLSGLTASTALALNASKEIVSVTNTGTGDNVLATSPTLTTPNIGDATATSVTNAGTLSLAASGTNIVEIKTNGTQRAQFTSGGYLKASNTGSYLNSLAAYHEMQQSAADFIAYVVNSNATPFGINIGHITDANSTGSPFLGCNAGAALGTLRAEIRSNGGIANYAANNVILSDRREKINFAPASSYLDKICAIPVQTFNYIDQNLEEDDGLTLGVVAQDVQTVAPELVTESNWGTKEEPKMRLEIYQTDLQYALMKALQELKAEFDAFKASHS